MNPKHPYAQPGNTNLILPDGSVCYQWVERGGRAVPVFDTRPTSMWYDDRGTPVSQTMKPWMRTLIPCAFKQDVTQEAFDRHLQDYLAADGDFPTVVLVVHFVACLNPVSSVDFFSAAMTAWKTHKPLKTYPPPKWGYLGYNLIME